MAASGRRDDRQMHTRVRQQAAPFLVTAKADHRNYDCNAQDKDQRYATTVFANTVLSAPAFEVRWRSEDLKHGTAKSPGPGASISLPTRTVILDGPASRMNSVHTAATTVTTTPTPIVVTTTAAASESTAPAPGATPLGPGYVAAIAVGTAFGALALVLAVLLWTLRRRSRAREEALSSGDSVVHGTVEGLEPAVSQQQSQGPPAEMEHSPTGARELPAGSSGLAPSQLSSRHPMGPFEMATEPKVDSK